MAQTSQAKAQTMRAVALDEFGGPEALKIQNLPIPQIEAQEVLIRVEAAGVGRGIRLSVKADLSKYWGSNRHFHTCLALMERARSQQSVKK